ncbi:substrate-binding domain-containing protein [Phyllobacterium endophyticum]|uniref:substrate-binding domain-containing protein n=1 Tax=Phyllobacterium endophyticum TaxID=1149773 RepID=UPI0011C8D6F7|nr:substrate-binding domain-containing protein [Phyllobacterium endophyticum]TXR47018.1 sulfate transporter [Phyllobacterium endophyticum]
MRYVFVAGALALGSLPGLASAQDSITVASTTSTEQSGLFGHILPVFKDKTGIEVRVIAQGTGQALDTGRRGDVDVVFVHAKAAEEEFVKEGSGIGRKEVMYNDFVIVGPGEDPAGIKGGNDAVAALKKISAAKAVFASRGDDSGTHKAELALWEKAGINPSGEWYRELGTGMGPTLNTSSQMLAYTLTDRATWLSFDNKGALEVVVEGDSKLFNQYGVILVNPGKHSHVKAKQGRAFIDWLVSKDGQNAIAEYKINGQQLFFPNAAETQ